MIDNKMFQQFVFWGVWLIIPLVCELIIGMISAIFCIIKYYFHIKPKPISFYPVVTILIPVYNSEATLKKCLESIVEQDYPNEKLEVYLIDNGSRDKSNEIYYEFQKKNIINIWWLNSNQGKAKALNKGIFLSNGKYIVNVDSDGWLDKNAIKNIVIKFENDKEIACMTGVVLTEYALIDKTRSLLLKLIRKCEFFEYTESFLVARNFHSKMNSMYTLAGAFSCFRREVILKTEMYNFITVGEDTDMTFQIRKNFGKKIILCENAFFYVDPIEDLNKLYTQRQRWQRGEIEVASLYKSFHIGNILRVLKKPYMKLLVNDHTLVFPRLIWFFGMIYLYYINYPLKLLISSNVLIYLAYVINGFAFMFASILYLRNQPKEKKYLKNNWYICFLVPIYRFLLYWIRLAGIINSATQYANWKTKNFTEEMQEVKLGIKRSLAFFKPLFQKIYYKLNNTEETIEGRGKNINMKEIDNKSDRIHEK